ncbi:MAG TPA: MXAN_5187 C-terminal domain-containing protein [Thermoanaerobaculia bacterium]|nr:MXAN_5187 C-terminal domain-containing protein [Thermoanaerobaculia bacterium]
MIKQDDELDKLEEDIRRLKNKYDQFFTGIIKVPPSFERHQVESSIHEISKQKMRDNTRRFRLNTIISRYNQFREMWGRKMREREEGPIDFRRRQAAMTAAPPPPPPVAAPASRVTSNGDDPYVRMTPGSNGEEVRRLYDEIEREHVKMGKHASVTLDQLAAMIQKQSDMVREKYHVKTVAFRVETVDGKVKLKAKPLQD